MNQLSSTYRGHHARGSAVVMAVGLLVMLAMIGATFVVVSLVDRREAVVLNTVAPMKGIAAGQLDEVVRLLGAQLRAGEHGPYERIDNVNETIDYPHDYINPLLASADAAVFPANATLGWQHLTNFPGASASVPKRNLYADASNVLFINDAGIPKYKYQDVSGWREVPLVDTDGIVYTVAGKQYDGDAVLRDTGIRDRVGRAYYAAVRVVDASSRVNVNLAHRTESLDMRFDSTTGSYNPMPATDVSLACLAGNGDVNIGLSVADRAHKERLGLANKNETTAEYMYYYGLRPGNIGYGGSGWANNSGSGPGQNIPKQYLPFDMTDMMGACWYGQTPGCASGRLFDAISNKGPDINIFNGIRRFITPVSATRIIVPRDRSPKGLQYKADLNRSDFDELYKSFYQLLVNVTDAVSRARQAAQLAANTIDFRDRDDDPTRMEIPDLTGEFVYGLERQPFITEAGYYMIKNGAAVDRHFALELYNPYMVELNVTGWQLHDYTANTDVAIADAAAPIAERIIPPNRRMIIASSATVKNNQFVAPSPKNIVKVIATLDLRNQVGITRPGGAGKSIVVGKVSPGDFTAETGVWPTITDEATYVGPNMQCVRRCDDLRNAVYTLKLHKSVMTGDITAAPGATNKLGSAKDDVLLTDLPKTPAGLTATPAPPYVRNGGFVSVGDLCRIFRYGPTETLGLDEQLTYDAGGTMKDEVGDEGAANGRLALLPRGTAPAYAIPVGGYASGPGKTRIPAVPIGCMASDFVMVNSPYADGMDNDGDGCDGWVSNAAGNSLTDSGRNWAPNCWITPVPRRVKITAGKGAGQIATIANNTPNTLNITANWAVQPDNTSRYAISPFDGGDPSDPNYCGDPNGGEMIVYGHININTASREVLQSLLSGLPQAERDAIVYEIIAYRDQAQGPVYNWQNRTGYIAGLRDEQGPLDPTRPTLGFASAGEIAIPIFAAGASLGNNAWKLPLAGDNSNSPDCNYMAAVRYNSGPPPKWDSAGDDGLWVKDDATQKTYKVQGDLARRQVFYSWLSNHITVRSDVFIAYIRVDLRDTRNMPAPALGSTPEIVATNMPVVSSRRYVAVIDRTNVRGYCQGGNVMLDRNDQKKKELFDATRNWTPDCWAGANVEIISGSGLGQIRGVVSNTNNTLTLDRPWDLPPAGPLAPGAYQIVFKPSVLMFGLVR